MAAVESPSVSRDHLLHRQHEKALTANDPTHTTEILRLRSRLYANRYTHATLALCALLVAAGCVGPLPVGNQPDATPTAATSTLPPASVHPGMTAGLTLYTRLPVHVAVTKLGRQGRGVVVDRTFDERSRIEYGDGAVFRANGDYRVVIAVNGTVR